MSTDTLSTLDGLEADVRAALRREILRLADTKRILGIRFSDWLLGAPSIETGIAASSMAQDEWGHARLLYAMLKDFGEDPVTIEHDREPSAYANAPALDLEFEDWAEFVAAMVVVDGALTARLEGFQDGRYETARTRLSKMLGEEEFHRDMGLAWLRRLANGSPEARKRIADAVTKMLPSTLAWMAPDDAPTAVLAGAGLGDTAADTLARFRAVYAGPFGAIGVEIPEAPVSLTAWDAERGRGEGMPDEEAIERARGDRNRMLFVE